MKIRVSHDMMRRLSVNSYRRFGRAGCLHIWGLHSLLSKPAKTT